MRRLALAAVAFWGLGWACTLSIETNPQGGVTGPTTVAITVRAGATAERLTLSLKQEGRWGDWVTSWQWSQTSTGSVSLPVNFSMNGQYILTASADLCGQPAIAQSRFTVMIPWTIGGGALGWLLWREAEATNYIKGLANDVNGGQPMFIEGLVTGLAEPVRAILRDYLVKGYLNRDQRYPPACSGLCYAIAPVQMRLYAVQGVGGLFQQGWAGLGLYGGLRDSRSYELGTKGVAGVLIVRGYRHDYILLSARGDFSDAEITVVEMPKGGSELFRKALSLNALQQGAREVMP